MPAWGVPRPTVVAVHPPTVREDPTPLGPELIELGRSHGLAAVGIASAGTFDSTRADLIERRQRGLHGGMQFTYRNPERSTDPGRILPGARALVVGAWGYRRRDEPDPAGREGSVGVVARYARSDVYAGLRGALEPVAQRLREGGWRAVVVCDDNALVDRAAAHRAGVGWFGKNSLILLPGLGSWFVLGSVVTDAPLAPTHTDEPSAPGAGCGRCDRCRTACPTGALVEPGVLDARRCLAWLVQAPGPFPEEHRRSLGARIYGCDDCQQVCPINRLADRRRPPPEAEADAVSTVDLIALLDAPDDALMRSYGRWYVPARDPRYLRRNALIALGNVGDPGDADTVRCVRHWTASGDDLLAEHARWAARALGIDPDPDTGPVPGPDAGGSPRPDGR